jgi:hypothetical protein
MYKLVAQMGFGKDENPCYEKIYLDEPLTQSLVKPFSSTESLVIVYLRLGQDLNNFDFNHEEAELQLINAIVSEHPDLQVDVSDFIKKYKEHPLPFSENALDGRR